jgi:hypothetical protein
VTQTQTSHNPRFSPTVRGSLSLAQLALASAKAQETKQTIGEAVSRLRFWGSNTPKTKAKPCVSVIANTVKVQKPKPKKRETFSCLACFRRTSKVRAAIVAFKLANGSQGVICGDICSQHQAGAKWRGVGTIESISEPTGPLRRVFPDASIYSLPSASTPKVEMTVEEPKVEEPKPTEPTVEASKPLSASQAKLMLALTGEGHDSTVAALALTLKLSASTIRRNLKVLLGLGLVSTYKLAGKPVWTAVKA